MTLEADSLNNKAQSPPEAAPKAENNAVGMEHRQEGKNAVGLILAAGFSSRMGTFKPLLQIGDMTAIEWTSDTLKRAGIGTVVGVTGFLRELSGPAFEAAGILEAYNSDFEQGMFTSIKAGIARALADFSPEGFFLMLVDCPLAPPEVLEQIWEKHLEASDAFIVPCFRGKKGHPLFIPANYAEEILAYEGEGGLKAITNRHEDRLIRLETGTEAVVLDMDTPEGYEELLQYWKKQEGKAKTGQNAGVADRQREASLDWEAELKGRRLFLVRHGEIRQHKEKIFLGQTDVPLSDRGREQAAAAAEELIRQETSVDRIYTSDLSRAAETAEIIWDGLCRGVAGGKDQKNDGQKEGMPPEIPVVLMPRLREMSLGEWDGKFIREIRERYPEEYQRRGENLLTYKYGNDSENFYDLQYRAMKGFEEILDQERKAGNEGGDIVIVSHSGVINVILSNLRRTELKDEIKNHIPNGGVVTVDFTNAKEKQL